MRVYARACMYTCVCVHVCVYTRVCTHDVCCKASKVAEGAVGGAVAEGGAVVAHGNCGFVTCHTRFCHVSHASSCSAACVHVGGGELRDWGLKVWGLGFGFLSCDVCPTCYRRDCECVCHGEHLHACAARQYAGVEGCGEHVAHVANVDEICGSKRVLEHHVLRVDGGRHVKDLEAWLRV